MSAQVTTVARSLETPPVEPRHDWKRGEVAEIYRTPLTELVFRAQSVHRQSHAPDPQLIVKVCSFLTVPDARQTWRQPAGGASNAADQLHHGRAQPGRIISEQPDQEQAIQRRSRPGD